MYLVAVEMKKTKVKLYQPMFVGFSVLELHFGHIKPMYGENTELLICPSILNCMTLQSFPRYHHLHNTAKKKVLGEKKDESFCVLATAFVEFKCIH